jgi:hypothetical protein
MAGPPGLWSDDAFLDAQYGRILKLVEHEPITKRSDPPRSITPQHRAGLQHLLRHVYNLCWSAQALNGVPRHLATARARSYLRGLEPPSFQAFTIEANRAASIPLELLSHHPQWSKTILRTLKGVVRDVGGLEGIEREPSVQQDMASDVAKHLKRRLTAETPDMESIFDKITPEIILRFWRTEKRARDFELANYLAAHLLRLPPKGRSGLEIYRERAREGWRVRRWESRDTQALADRLCSLPDPATLANKFGTARPRSSS